MTAWVRAAFALAVFLLGGCGESTLSGLYQCIAPQNAGRLEFRKDGTFSSRVTSGPGAGQGVTGKYKVEGKRFQLCNPVGHCIAGTVDGKTLTFDHAVQGTCQQG